MAKNVQWRKSGAFWLICAAIIFVVAVRIGVVDAKVVILSLFAGLLFMLAAPRVLNSTMTMREAWSYLRNSEVRQRERAKTIIAEHLRATSRQNF